MLFLVFWCMWLGSDPKTGHASRAAAAIQPCDGRNSDGSYVTGKREHSLVQYDTRLSLKPHFEDYIATLTQIIYHMS